MRGVQHHQIPIHSQFIHHVGAKFIAEIMRQSDEVERNDNKTCSFAVLEKQYLGVERVEDGPRNGIGSTTAAKRDPKWRRDVDIGPTGKGGGTRFAAQRTPTEPKKYPGKKKAWAKQPMRIHSQGAGGNL